jgi:hypothetical protein
MLFLDYLSRILATHISVGLGKIRNTGLKTTEICDLRKTFGAVHEFARLGATVTMHLGIAIIEGRLWRHNLR